MFSYKSRLTFAQLKKIEPLRPTSAGGSWLGVKHSDMVRALCAALATRGWEVIPDSQRYAVSKDEADLAVAMELRMPTVLDHEEYRPAIGLLTSNARRKATKLLFGAHDLTGGMFVTDEIVLGRKRERTFNLTNRLERALQEVAVAAEYLPGSLNLLRKRKLTKVDAEGFLCLAGERGVLPWSRIGKARKLYLEGATCPAGTSGTNTAYALLACLDAEISRSPSLTQMEQRLKAFHICAERKQAD